MWAGHPDGFLQVNPMWAGHPDRVPPGKIRVMIFEGLQADVLLVMKEKGGNLGIP